MFIRGRSLKRNQGFVRLASLAGLFIFVTSGVSCFQGEGKLNRVESPSTELYGGDGGDAGKLYATSISVDSSSLELIAGNPEPIQITGTYVGAPAPLKYTTDLTLIPGSGGMFCSDPICLIPISFVTIEAGQTQETVYYVSTTAGTQSLTISSISLGTLSILAEVRADQDSAHVAIASEGGSTQIEAGQCSPHPLSLKREDVYGNPVPLESSTTYMIEGTQETSLLFGDPACEFPILSKSITIASFTSESAEFYYYDTQSVSYEIYPSGYPSTPYPVTVTAGPATDFAVKASESVKIGGCHLFHVLSADEYGNPAAVVDSAVSIEFSQKKNIFLDSACTNSIENDSLSLEVGDDQLALYLKPVLLKGVEFQVSFDSAKLESTIDVSIEVEANPPHRLSIEEGLMFSPEVCNAVPIRVLDENGYQSKILGETTLTISSNIGWGTAYLDPDCTIQGNLKNLEAGDQAGNFWIIPTLAQPDPYLEITVDIEDSSIADDIKTFPFYQVDLVVEIIANFYTVNPHSPELGKWSGFQFREAKSGVSFGPEEGEAYVPFFYPWSGDVKNSYVHENVRKWLAGDPVYIAESCPFGAWLCPKEQGKTKFNAAFESEIYPDYNIVFTNLIEYLSNDPLENYVETLPDDGHGDHGEYLGLTDGRGYYQIRLMHK